MNRPESCPNCGEWDYTLSPPSGGFSKMCKIGTLRDYPGWQFYHE